MLDSLFKRALVDRLARGVRAAGERSLALLITAGVASCGGQTSPADASTDQHSDAPPDSNVIVEAPAYDAGATDSGVIIEAPAFDAGAG